MANIEYGTEEMLFALKINWCANMRNSGFPRSSAKIFAKSKLWKSIENWYTSLFYFKMCVCTDERSWRQTSRAFKAMMAQSWVVTQINNCLLSTDLLILHLLDGSSKISLNRTHHSKWECFRRRMKYWNKIYNKNTRAHTQLYKMDWITFCSWRSALAEWKFTSFE